MARDSSARMAPSWSGPAAVEETAWTDAELVRRVIAGDARGATVMWERFAPIVRRVLQRALSPYAEVEDLVQEVFLRLFRSLPKLREPEAFRGYMYTIATSVAVSELRRLRIRRWLHLTNEGVLPDQADDPRDDDGREALSKVYDLLSKVSEQERMTFVLRTVEGLELTEVANVMKISLATVKRKLTKVHDLLELELGNDPAFAPYLQPLAGKR